MIKLFDPHVTEEEIEAAKEVLESHNWASGAGTHKVQEFEDRFNGYLGSKQVAAVNSGTAALHLALALIDLRNKNVFVPSLTFASTVHAVVYNQGNPVFVDVDPRTLCMDPGDLKEKVQSHKGAAILPVHFGGMPCDMSSLSKIADKHGLTIVDDAAHACGALYNGKKIGSFEEMSCFSFHPVKNLAMPAGGAISINGKFARERKRKLNSLRWCGIDDRQETSYDVTSVSPNYYMNEVSAAIGLVQLSKLDDLNARRKEIAKRYASEIDIEHKMPFSNDCAYHLYWLISGKRERMIKHLQSKGIEAGTHYRPVHTMSAYRERMKNTKLPITEDIGRKVITIPIHPNLADDDVSYVIKTINSFH